ncbi:hypothetical protein PYW08_003692 [Mythimna loreyi]|uniref:Uncharacterized protein n=1 Tax=Mythimna loreyi TaxID=667449 RepID=A0ACC2QTE2_9NEOP|nr:hypothetical protein PYW08_003692 [Mythimna loreyi]
MSGFQRLDKELIVLRWVHCKYRNARKEFHSVLYFFHHYELPVVLQQEQLQQLLRVGVYHDSPGRGTQATPPTTQSSTQTAQNTLQSTTQTLPSVSTAQTNTLRSGAQFMTIQNIFGKKYNVV